MRTRSSMHADRNAAIQYINNYTQDLQLNNERSDLGETVLQEIRQSGCDQSISTVRQQAFLNADPSVSIDGHLFGSISESIRQEVAQEINGSVGIQVDAKHLAPDDMEVYCEVQKHDISESLIQHVNVDTELLQYLEMYNELARRNEHSSEVVEDRVSENDRVLDLFDSWATEVDSDRVALYGMAVTDFVTDGGSVDLDACKKTLVEEINKDMKGSVVSGDPQKEVEEIRQCLREMSGIVEDSNPQLKAVFEAAAGILDEKADVLEVD